MVGLMSQQCAAAWLLVWWCYSWSQGGEGGEICRICPDMLVSADSLRCVGTSSWRRWHKCLIQQKVKVNRSKLSFPVLDFSAWVLWCYFFQFKADIDSMWDFTCFYFVKKTSKSIWSDFSIRCFSTTFWICYAEVGRYWRWSLKLKSLQEARYLFSDQNPDERSTAGGWLQHRFQGDVRGWVFFELVATLLVLCVRNQRPPLLEWEADVSEEFSWLQQFFSCLSFECCLSPLLPPLLPFHFPSLLCTLSTFSFFLSSFQLSHRPNLSYSSICVTTSLKKLGTLPKVRSEASLTPLWRKQRIERMRKRAL